MDSEYILLHAHLSHSGVLIRGKNRLILEEEGYAVVTSLTGEPLEHLSRSELPDLIVSVEPFRGSGEMANYYRKPFGPGWALVGDARYRKDPITAMGISDAFRDAELLASALDDGFSGRRPFAEVLAHYKQRRNAASRPFYEFTLETARMKPLTVGQRELLRALPHHSAAACQFFGVLTGTVQPTAFFRPRTLFPLLGV